MLSEIRGHGDIGDGDAEAGVEVREAGPCWAEGVERLNRLVGDED